MDNSSSIILGCTVAIASSAIQSLGITLQRKSHLLVHPHTSNYHHYQKHKRNMWLFGFFLFIVANIFGSLIQITTLPLIILSPLQSIGLIFNSILSCMLLPGERFTKQLGYGTVVISIGAFIIAYQGNTSPGEDPSKKSFDRVLKLLLRKRFLCWFIATFVLVVVLLLVNYFISKWRAVLKEKQAAILQINNNNHENGSSSGSGSGSVSGSGVRLFMRFQRTLNKYQFIKGVNYGIISGTLTAHTFLFAKSLIDVIIQAILDKGLLNLFSRDNFTPYFLLLVMLAIIGFQLTAFNLGLSQILTSILYPLCFLVYNLMNLINDLTFNSLISEHKMTYGQLAWVIFGLSGVLFGVVLISWESAFGSGHHHGHGHDQSYSSLGCDDEDILMQLKFPYSSYEETTKLLDNSNSGSGSLETIGHVSEEVDDIDIGSSSSLTDRQPTIKFPNKRVLSYEQNQLLNSFGF